MEQSAEPRFPGAFHRQSRATSLHRFGTQPVGPGQHRPDDLLDVSRITRGGIELHKEDMDLRDIINTALESMGPMLEDRKAKVIIALSEEVLPVRGDADRLQAI